MERDHDLAAACKCRFARVLNQFHGDGSRARTAIVEEGKIVWDIELDFCARPAELLEPGSKQPQVIAKVDFAEDTGGGSHQGLGAVHELGSLRGALFDHGETVQCRWIEILVLYEQAQIAVEKREDVVHPVREAPDQLILKIIVSDLHSGDLC